MRFLGAAYVVYSVATDLIIWGGALYYFLKTNTKKDKHFLLRLSILFFISFCFLYEIIIQDKSLRFVKNYKYFIMIFLIFLSYIIIKKTNGKIYYIIPLIAWIFYITILTIIDDLKIKDLYIQ